MIIMLYTHFQFAARFTAEQIHGEENFERTKDCIIAILLSFGMVYTLLLFPNGKNEADYCAGPKTTHYGVK